MSKQESNLKKRTGLGRGLGALLEDSDKLQAKGLHASDYAGTLDSVNSTPQRSQIKPSYRTLLYLPHAHSKLLLGPKILSQNKPSISGLNVR